MIDFDVAIEGSLETVVILLRDGIEFVIVATRTLDSEAHDTATEGGDHVIEIFVAEFGIVFFAEADLGMVAEKAGGGESFGAGVGEFVAGELFVEEAVVGFVGVEGGDDVVAVTPGVGTVEVVFLAVGIGVAGEVEPVASPAFAVVRGGEEFVDEIGPGVGGIVVDEGGDLRGSWREAEKVEVGAADEGVAVCLGSGGEVAAAIGYEEVDGVCARGDGGTDGLAEGPPVAGAGGKGHVFEGGALVFEGGALGGFVGCLLCCAPFCTTRDPVANGFDFSGAEFAVERHGRFFNACDHAVEAALFGIAGDDAGAMFAADEGAFARLEV